jgi:hypothetical protein
MIRRNLCTGTEFMEKPKKKKKIEQILSETIDTEQCPI